MVVFQDNLFHHLPKFSMADSIRQQMFTDLTSRHIFDQARQYAFAYVDESFERNVYPTEEALANLQQFEEDFPATPTPASDVLEFLHTHGSPATVTQTAGRYFGFVHGGAIPAALAAKWLADFWDQSSSLYVASPIAAKLEEVVEKWLAQLLKLPAHTAAGFVTGSFAATFCGLAAARYRLLQRAGWDVNEQGLFGAPPLRIVTGRQVHSSVLKAISLLGLGKSIIEWVDVDEQGRILADQLPPLDAKTIVILQAGNVNSGAFDEVVRICQKAHQVGAWVHIDGAFGLWARAVDAFSHLTEGIELANSWSVDGHKTLNVPYDCGIVLCEDREALVSALHMSGSYLVLSEARDGMFYTPDMSRRARVIELWAALKYLGQTGVEALVYGLHLRAVQFAQELTDAEFTILNDVVFNQVLVCCASDEATIQVLAKVQALRECWCGGSVWQGRSVIRISVCSWATTAEDVSRSVRSFIQARTLITT